MDAKKTPKYKPNWIRPTDVLKIRKVKHPRKRPFQDDDEQTQDCPDLGLNQSNESKKRITESRRRSIFSLSSNSSHIAAEQNNIKDFSSFLDKNSNQIDLNQKEVSGQCESEEWHEELCLDWSLKTSLRISTKNTFSWSSNNLKSSEESSGISAFVRCIDIEPLTTTKQHQFQTGDSNPQLDTSLGAQFHQCCLYWQHPNIPSFTLFPRDSSSVYTDFSTALSTNNSLSQSFSSSQNSAPIRFDEKMLDCMQLEWVEALRSSFQLLRTRQNPFFYVCSSTFTCLFCSAGTRDQQIKIFVTPSTKGFRDLLKREGIKFETPYFKEEQLDSSQSQNSSQQNSKIDDLDLDEKTLGDDDENHFKNEESDDETDNWLDEMGISQDVPLSISRISSQFESTSDLKLKSTLLIINGAETLPFFNFLINSKSTLVTSAGPLAGIPPTILSPVAFHGATLRSLKVKQKKVKNAQGDAFHSIEMTGPILPNVMHMLCTLLSKTVSEYKIHVNTLTSSIPLNIINPSTFPSIQGQDKPSAFELQNLSDCGLSKSALELFCKCNNCSTIKEVLHRKNGLFYWH